MKPKAAISHPYPDRPDIVAGTHLKGIHLHFDINGDHAAVKEAFAPLIARHPDFLEWDNFVLPTVDDLRKLYGSMYRRGWDEYLAVIADPVRFGAPAAHLSAKKFYGDIFSPTFQKYLNLYQEGKDLLATLPFSGYIEVEDVTEEHIKGETGEPPDFDAAVNAFSEPPIEKVRLADVREVEYDGHGYLAAEGDAGVRHFRTTEIHLTFRKLSRVHPGLIAGLLKSGFYSAFQMAGPDDYKFIATIQGFHHEISQIYVRLVEWLKPHYCVISCGVTLKREDIMSFFVFGSDSKIQQAIAPTFTKPLN